MNPAGVSHLRVSWKINPPVFSFDSSDYISFRMEVLLFAEYFRFGNVFIIFKRFQSGIQASTPNKSVIWVRVMMKSTFIERHIRF